MFTPQKPKASVVTFDYKVLLSLATISLLFGMDQAAFAQQSPPPGTDAAERASSRTPRSAIINRSASATAAARVGTSPFDPPKQNDHLFVTDTAPKLDTGCIFRSSGPITFDIEITRALALTSNDLNSDGTLKNAKALVDAGLLSPTATLSMPGFDIDSEAVVQGFQPERDRVSFNGQEIGFLKGVNNQWFFNTFQIPIEKVKFAVKGANGVAPAKALNQVRIDIDTANTSEVWCTEVDWGSQSFKAMSPIILIHGNASNGGFFKDTGFTPSLASQGLLYDNSITTPIASIAANGNALNGLISGIVKSFGVDSIHLIAHSKGGLDSREYLANFQPQNNKDFKVLSLTTLSTPHRGSILADLQVKRNAAAQIASQVDYKGFPLFIEQVLSVAPPLDRGTEDLTQEFLLGFNNSNVPLLPSDTVINTVSADADISGNGSIDSQNEYAGLLAASKQLQNLPSFVATGGLNVSYQTLRTVSAIRVTTSLRQLRGGALKVATLTAIPTPTPQGNDIFVTIQSAEGPGTLQVKNRSSLVGAQGRDHATVANGGVAQIVVPWLINIERQKGDLK